MSANRGSRKSSASVVSPNVLKRVLSFTHASDADSPKRLKREGVYDDRFSAIEEHGVIGNMRTAALVSVKAEVSWFCYPFFDSPSLFASILDRNKGGHWSISTYIEEDDVEPSSPSSPAPPRNDRPSSPPNRQHKGPPARSSPEASVQRELLRRYVTHKQLYHSDTNVLISRFLSDAGVGQVMDYMPAGKLQEKAKRWLVRELGVVRGKMCFQVELVPAFNYARDEHVVEIERFGCRFISDRLVMELRTTSALDWQLTEDGKGVTCLLELNENEKETFIFCESQKDADGHWATPDGGDSVFHVDRSPSAASALNGELKEDWNEGSATDACSSQSPSEGQSCEEKARKSAANKGDDLATRGEKLKKSLGNIVWKSTDSLRQSEDKPPDIRPPKKQSSRATKAEKKDDSKETADKAAPDGREAKDGAESAGPVTRAKAHEMEEESKEAKGEGEADGEGEGEEDALTIRPVPPQVSERLQSSTIDFWREWINKCTYNGRWREVVYRSALVLKLMTFEPTGAIVAALTTSLPEEVGGERNWDYRFTWIRDSSFTLYAFLKLGFKEEAAAFMHWIAQRCQESAKQDGSLQIMYGLHGEHTLKEKHLTHLDGFRNSTPVRIGNNAYDQMQLDIYGELMDTVYLSNKYAEPISYDFWIHVRRMVDWICDHWHEEDEGVWETRGGRKSFVYSKVMAWVAVDRGIRLTEKRSFPADVARWRKVRDEIYEEIQTKGWNEKKQAYTQSYGSDVLDASVLIMPLVFFAAPTDPRFVSTLEQILKNTSEGGLVSNNLVFRYTLSKKEANEDGLKGQEGTFSICTFWAVEAAARLGVYQKESLEKSRFMFEGMLGYANHVGLYSEEIGQRGEHLGNFPQAFTHLALISAAINLDKALSQKVPGQSHMDV